MTGDLGAMTKIDTMTEAQSFHEDCLILAQEQLAKGRLERRNFLKISAALGALYDVVGAPRRPP